MSGGGGLGPFTGRGFIADYTANWPQTLWSPNAVIPTIRNTFPAAISFNGQSHILDCSGAPGANKILRVGENRGSTVDGMPSWRDGTYYQEFSCHWDATIDGVGGVNSYFGISLGDLAPPYAAAPASPLIEARWCDGGAIARLYVARGDGVTPSTTVDAVGIVSKGYEARMIVKHNPGVSVEFWGMDPTTEVRRKLCELRDPNLLPPANTTFAKGWGFVIATGAVVAGPRVVVSPPQLLVVDTL